MNLYLDTSVLVAALTREARTETAQAWLAKGEPSELAISGWVVTEFSAALSIKQRTGQLDADRRAEALAEFANLCAESLRTLAVSAIHFLTAARFAEHHDLGLRAGDALHLAICADYGGTLVTLDQRLSHAGPALGVRTALI